LCEQKGLQTQFEGGTDGAVMTSVGRLCFSSYKKKTVSGGMQTDSDPEI